MLHPLFFSGMTGLSQVYLREAAFLEDVSGNVGTHRAPPGPWTFSEEWTVWGVPHTKSVFFKNWKAHNLGACSTLITRFHLHTTNKTRDTQASGINLVNYVGYTFQDEIPPFLMGS